MALGHHLARNRGERSAVPVVEIPIEAVLVVAYGGGLERFARCQKCLEGLFERDALHALAALPHERITAVLHLGEKLHRLLARGFWGIGPVLADGLAHGSPRAPTNLP